MEITELSNNEDFKKELDEYLEKIQYDEKQIQDELRIEFLKSINNDMRFFDIDNLPVSQNDSDLIEVYKKALKKNKNFNL